MNAQPGPAGRTAHSFLGGPLTRPLLDLSFQGNAIQPADAAGSNVHVISSEGPEQRAVLLAPRQGPTADSSAIFLDGWSTWAEIQFTASNEPALTVTAWFAPRAFARGGARGFTAIIDALELNTGFALGHNRSGYVAAVVGGRMFVGTGRLELDSWNHLALSIANGRAELRVDGEPAGTFDVPPGDIRLPARMTLGRSADSDLVEGRFPAAAASGLLGPVRVLPAAHPPEVPEAVNAADTAPDRARFAADHHRPIAHFSAPQGWMNEPHAALQVDGMHHLFYQHNPAGPYWGNIAWGHAISKDLVHWQDENIAVAPSSTTVAPDGVWSGSSVTAPNGEHLLYLTAGDFGRRPDQTVAVARPTGSGWAVDEHPVLEMPTTVPGSAEPLVRGQFRDPFVWRDRDDWFLLVGAGLEGRGGAALLFHSRDGDRWEQQEPLLVGDVARYPATGEMWELPVLLPIGNGSDGRRRHALFIAPWWAGESEHHLQHVWHWTGVWDAASRRFTPDDPAPREFDGGGHLTGPSGTVLQDGRSILWSIAQDKRSLDEFAGSGWAHNAGFPLELGLHADGALSVRPVAELGLLHERPFGPDHTITDAESAAAQVSFPLRGRHLDLEFWVEGSGLEIEVLRSSDGVETTVLGVTGTEVWIDRSRSSRRSEHTEGRRGIRRPESPSVHARLLVDGSMVELYVDDRVSLTSRAYPVSEDADQVLLRVADGARILSFSAHYLHSAYRPRKAD